MSWRSLLLIFTVGIWLSSSKRPLEAPMHNSTIPKSWNFLTFAYTKLTLVMSVGMFSASTIQSRDRFLRFFRQKLWENTSEFSTFCLEQRGWNIILIISGVKWCRHQNDSNQHFLKVKFFKTTHISSKLIHSAYEVFYSSNLMSHEMGFFINQVQYYINFEILECSWAVLVEKLENASDLDELILAHLKFLDELADGCLLADNFWDNLKALRSIFDQIVRFEVEKWLFFKEQN